MAIDIDAIIAAVQAAQLVKDKDLKPAPQSFDPLLSKFVPLLSDNGAARQVLYGPDGNPISVADNKLAVRAAELEEKLEAVRVLLNTLAGEDFATQTTLAQILGKMIAAPATEAKQDVIAGHVDGVETLLTALKEKDFATETKLEAVRVLLNSLAGEDFATQTTLAQILAKMIASPATEAKQAEMLAALGNQSTAAKQDALAGLVGAIDAAAVSDPAVSGTVISLLKGLLSQLQAGSPVSVTESSLPAGAATDAEIQTLQEKVDALNTKIDGITDGTAPAKTETQLTGSLMEIYKATVAERPAANSVPVGTCFMAVNTGEIWQSNGTDWVEV